MCKKYLWEKLRGIKRITAIFLAAVLSVSVVSFMLPLNLVKAQAAGTRKNLQMVTNATAANIEGAQGSNVYFGTYPQSSDGNNGYNRDPIKWRVLQNSGSRLFLLANKNLDCKKYNESDTSVTWETCTLRDWLNGTDEYVRPNGNFIDSAFSETEKSSIAGSSVVHSDNITYNIPGGNDTTDTLFLLSRDEVFNAAYGFTASSGAFTNDESRIATNTDYATTQGVYEVNGNGIWWLRTPGFSGRCAVLVDDVGSAFMYGYGVFSEVIAVRPAFNLNLSSVVFTSAAVSGKSSGTVGAGALTAVEDYSGNDWKVTLLDDGTFGSGASGHAGFSASRVDSGAVAAGNSITVSYSGANTGSNEYVSAILVSTANENLPLYYGRIANNSASSTGTSITIPSGLADGDYKLKVFAEQYNGDYMTDYISAFSTINITVDATAPGPSQPSTPNPPAAPSTPSAGPVDYFADLKSAFDYAIALGGNQTVTWNRDSVLNYDIMKLLAENPSITLAFSYTYEDMDYTVTIPGRLAKFDPEIPIYGPLYLYGMYGGTVKKHQ